MAKPLRADTRPLYVQLVEAVLNMIDEEELTPGAALPSEPELARIFDVGRSTVREAMTYLVHEGIVQRTQGSKTVLTATPHASLGLEVLESFESLAARQGWTCGTRDIRIDESHADLEQAQNLNIAPGSAVTVLTRVKTKNDQPIALMESVVPASEIDPSLLADKFSSSITDLLAEQADLQFAVASVSATVAGDELAAALRIQPSDPLIVLEESFYCGAENPAAWNRNYVLPGALTLEILRRVPQSGVAAEWRNRRAAALREASDNGSS